MTRHLRISILALSFVILVVVCVPLLAVHAQSDGSVGIIKNPLNSGDLIQLLGKLLSGVVRIGMIFLTLAFVWTGFQFVVAQGNEEKLSKARTTLLWTVIGAAIILGAQLIASIIAATAASIAP